MARSRISVSDCGDAALLVTIDGDGREDTWGVARGIATALLASRPTGLVDVVASYASVFVSFDPLRTDRDQLRGLLTDRAITPLVPAGGREFLVPVVYGDRWGEDLDGVAEDLGLLADDVVRLHTGEPWTVRLLGPPLGMPMMDGPPVPRSVPRRADPRVRVPEGSVAVSGHQSVVYPAQMPGGWRLIGRTPAFLIDLARDPVTDYVPGDRLRFVAVPPESWDRWHRPLREIQEELTEHRSGRHADRA
jgi:KipI family sensor histidine kinase inhibitor